MGIPRGGHRLLSIAVMAACTAITIAASAELSLASFARIGEAEVPPTGREVALPLPQGAKAGDLRVVLSGVFECSYNGRTYDALNTTSDTGVFDQRHGYVHWSPGDMELVDSDPSAHRYVLKLAETMAKLPVAASAWVDVDQFVTDLIITPSEVRGSLHGSLRLEVWRARGRRTPATLILGAIALLAALVLVHVWRRVPEEMADVAALVSRIERKYRSAVRAVGPRGKVSFRLRMELERLRDGARELAKHIAAFRRAAATVDQRQLEGEIAQAEQQLQQADRNALRQEIEAMLAAKRKLHRLLADTEANESRYLLRLSKIESAIDATTVWATSQEGQLADERAEDQAIAELELELESVDEAIEELRVLD